MAKPKQTKTQTTGASNGAPLHRRVILALLAIALAWIAVWSSSVGGAFLFDDIPEIVNNESLHDPGSMEWLEHGRRPVTNLTLAINWAMGGGETEPFHATNMLIHLLASVAIYGLVLVTARTERIPEKWRRRAPVVAGFTALFWLVHPLQTQSVTYIVQRGEALAGMWYALTMLAAAIGITREKAGRDGGWFFALAVLACALGMGSKAVAVTAPIAVLLWDAVFAGGTLGRALRARWTLYAGLALTWLVTVWLGVLPQVLSSGEGRTVGFGYEGATWWEYLLTQAHVIWHYAYLTIWPADLVLDYAWPFTSDVLGAIVPGGLLAIALLASVLGVVRGKWWGFAGAFFFLVLAPTSSVIPIADASMEHRMYLPLLALVALFVVGVIAGLDRLTNARPMWIAAPLFLLVATFLSMRTIERNIAYESPREMWRQVTIDRPNNARAWSNYGKLILDEDPQAALEPLRRAVELDPGFVLARVNFGSALIDAGRYDEALEETRAAIEAVEEQPGLLINLGRVRYRTGDAEGAVEAFEQALSIEPGNEVAQSNLEIVSRYLAQLEEARRLREAGRTAESARAYQRYLDNMPSDREALIEYASMMVAGNNVSDVLPRLERVLETDTSDPRITTLHHRASAVAQGRQFVTDGGETTEFSPEKSEQWLRIALSNIDEGRLDEAEEALRSAISFDPTNTSARYRLGVLFQRQGYHDEAVLEYLDLLELQPDRASVLSNLGQCYTHLNQAEYAESAFRRAIDADPDHFQAHLNLAILLDAIGRYEEAIRMYERTLEISPGNDKATSRVNALRRHLEQQEDNGASGG